MNVEIGAEAALFPEKEYIYGNFVAVKPTSGANLTYFIIQEIFLNVSLMH
jgi:hypothetical protein